MTPTETATSGTAAESHSEQAVVDPETPNAAAVTPNPTQTAQRRRTRTAVAPTTRRSTRIREREQKRVRFADEQTVVASPVTTAEDENTRMTEDDANSGAVPADDVHVHGVQRTKSDERPNDTVSATIVATETGATAALNDTTPVSNVTARPSETNTTAAHTALSEVAATNATQEPVRRQLTGPKRRKNVESEQRELATKRRATTGSGQRENMREPETSAATSSTTQPIATSGENDGDDGELETSTLQLTDTEIIEAQKASRFVKKALADGKYRGMNVESRFDLAVIETANGWRVMLSPTLWAVVFKEMHGSIWAGHLRGPHTYGRVAQLYWWPKLRRAVNQWIRGCPECGSRKARPREVIPPLRSIRGGDVCDRWALDVAGPFPTADSGERFVIAAVEYVTRYVVARCVRQHKAEDIATFLLEEVVLKFGSFRVLLTDGAPELTSSILDILMTMLQARQTNAVAYRPQTIGLVERFHRTWKDCVAIFMQDETQRDWNLWVRFATYAYNSARHSTVLLTPNELMMGRRLRSPNDLLRRTAVTEAGELTTYHKQLLAAMPRAQQCAEQARIREQERQARYYKRNVRNRREFKVGDRVWLYNPPRGQNATKFVHQWMGPLRIAEPVGYDNFRLIREDQTGETEEMIAHVSFLTSYYEPGSPLSEIAADVDEQLLYENTECHDETAAAPVRAAAAIDRRSTITGGGKRGRAAVDNTTDRYYTSGQLVERKRRRKRNKAGHYVLEYQLFPIGDTRQWPTNDGRHWTTSDGRPTARWVSLADYERYHEAERVVEDPWVGEDV